MKPDAAEDWIRERAKLTYALEDDPIDVRQRVRSTLAGYNAVKPAVDRTPLVVGASLLAVAASIMVALMPSLTLMTEPWISFWFI
ncbi:MAG: hypothetical protein AAGD07_12670 [Planctomycetota bacterium]